MSTQDSKPGQDIVTGHEPRQGFRFGMVMRFAWLPIPLLIAAIIAARVADLNESYKAETLTLVLSFTFYTLVSLGTLFLVGRNFLTSGTPGLLMLECGVLLWSLAGTAGDAVSHSNANVNVTIFNTGILLAGMCHLAGSILSLRPQRSLRPSPLWLGAGGALVLGALWLIAQAALTDRLPVFFIPGQGGTLVRTLVLISAIIMFALSAGLLLSRHRAERTSFTSWYAFALLLLAVGLFGVMIQLSLGSVVNWLSRAAQWLGGSYLFLASLAGLRESNQPLFPMEKNWRLQRYRYGVAITVVLTAAAVRLALLPVMGMRMAFLTFFPAVMLAALYGGLRAGLLATVVAGLLVGYFLIPSNGFFMFAYSADWLGLIIFLLSGWMIAWMSETMHLARVRASEAELQVQLAAEREAAVETLKKSEERYHTLFTGITEGFAIHEVITDEYGKPVDYRFLDVNPAFERLTGLKRQDVVGKTHNQVLPGNDPKWLRMYGQVALTGQPVQFENYAPNLKRHYEVLAYRPAPMQFAVIFMDITERKRVEEALRESERLYRAIGETIDYGVWVCAPDGRNIYASESFLKMAGLTQEECSNFGWGDALHPDDAERTIEAWKECVRTEGTWDIEHRFRGVDSQWHAVLARGVPVRNDQKEIICWAGINLDISNLKRAEEERERLHIEAENERRRLEAVLEALPVGVAITDAQGVTIRSNQVFEQVWGSPRPSTKSIDDYSNYKAWWADSGKPVAPEDWASAQVIRKCEPVFQQVMKIQRFDGSHAFVINAGAPFFNEHGRIAGCAVAIQDITELRKAQETLKRSHDELENRVRERTAELAQKNEELTLEIAERKKVEQVLRESENQLRVLASQILSAQESERKRIGQEVHDVLGSSLSAIKFKIEDILQRIDDLSVSRVIESLENIFPVIKETIEEVRRIQSDLRPPLLDDLGIVATLSWFCRRFQMIYSNIRVEPAVTIPEEEIPEHLKIVLFRIIQEAMNNICKYAKADSVYLGLQKIDGAIELCIRDNGEGFDLENLTSRDISKKGLGLVSMRERTEYSGGRFSIDSIKEKGTTIMAVWPV